MLRISKTSLRYSSVGIEFVTSVLLGLFVGQWADERYKTGGGLALLGFLLGVVTGFRSLWRASQQAQRDAEQQRDPEHRD